MTTRIHSAPATFMPSVRRTSIFAQIKALMGLARQRQALANLDDRALRDIGLTRQEAVGEAQRPVWDVPHHWSR
ncbi:MAG: DUF1127 domain-containing protein [Pseudomonadota bacterium]